MAQIHACEWTYTDCDDIAQVRVIGKGLYCYGHSLEVEPDPKLRVVILPYKNISSLARPCLCPICYGPVIYHYRAHYNCPEHGEVMPISPVGAIYELKRELDKYKSRGY